MKKLLLITLLTLITACGSIKNTNDLIADEKFELCTAINSEKRITRFGPTDGKLIYIQNVHSLLENSLIQENYLSEISKRGYSELLKKASKKEINSDFFKKFRSDLEFDPFMLFKMSHLDQCYGYLIDQLKILDKSSWQYKFRDSYWKFSASGDLDSSCEYLINALNKIPDEKFELIMYRKLFLDIIYTHLN